MTEQTRINNTITTNSRAVFAVARYTSNEWFGRNGNDFDEINDLVHKREILRQEGKFMEADEMRKMIKERYNVTISDGKYTVAGVFWRKEL